MIAGRYYLAGQSDFSIADLALQGDVYTIIIASRQVESGELSALRFSDRLGNIARKITLPNGAVFETADNDAIDLALKNSRQTVGFMGGVHLLERHMGMAILSIFLVVGVVFSSFKWGLPAASHVIAHALPDEANQALSSNVLDFLDEHFFEQSQLTDIEQNKIRNRFFNTIVPLYQAEEMPQFKLHFRLWSVGDEMSVANAFALPSGDIVITDRLVQLAETQDEIDIVLLHEMGHVVERHSLEQVIEGSAIVVAVSMAIGDVSWLADMGVGVGSFLISSFYSRSHETEADQFAYKLSLKGGIVPKSLGIILGRMENDMGMRREDECSATQADLNNSEADKEESRLSDYFSTHPSSGERAEMGERYQRCFEQGLTVCLVSGED